MHVRLKFLWVSDNEEEGGLGVPLKKRWVGLFVRDVECGRLSSPVLNKQEKKKKKTTDLNISTVLIGSQGG